MEREPLAERVRQWIVGPRRSLDAAVQAGSPVRDTGSIAIDVLVREVATRGPRPSAEGTGSPAEKLAYLQRVEDAIQLVEIGRELTALVLSRETSDRRFNGAQIIVVELEIEDPLASTSPRVISYDHLFGPATARSWKPGREIPIWIDPRDPDRIYAGR